MIIDIIFSRLAAIIFSTPVLSVMCAAVAYLLIGVMAGKIQEDFSNHLEKYDPVISLGIIFIGIYLLFLVGPLLTKVARFRASRPDYPEFELGAQDWFTVLEAISFFTVLVVYLLGTYTIVKLSTRGSMGRRLYYQTIGIFIFAVWMFMIFGIVFWR